MQDLPTNALTDKDIELLQSAGVRIKSALALKEQPSKLRLELVELSMLRFDIGRRMAIFKGHARDAMSAKYSLYKSSMSNNAAYKEAEMNVDVVKYKNSQGLFETAYEVIDSFITVNQSSLKIAVEEAKNTL